MSHPDVVFQSVRVFESFSALIALQPGVIVLPSVFEKSPLVLERKQTLATMQSHSLNTNKINIKHNENIKVSLPCAASLRGAVDCQLGRNLGHKMCNGERSSLS